VIQVQKASEDLKEPQAIEVREVEMESVHLVPKAIKEIRDWMDCRAKMEKEVHLVHLACQHHQQVEAHCERE
jgi:hypothetical protein